MTTNADRIQRALAKLDPQVVLVDYFDTLVTRTIDGRSLKSVAARHLAQRWDLGPPAAVLAGRREAEQVVRLRWSNAGFDPEHRIDEAATEMWDRSPVAARRNRHGSRDDFVSSAVEIELAVERLAQQTDDEVVQVLATSGRPLVLVSDFYFGPELFARMLAERGLAPLFRQVFVSCGPRLSKASGRLYPEVLARLAHDGLTVRPDQVLMIGDHPVSDGDQARRHGIATLRIERAERRPATPARAGRVVARVQRRWPGPEAAGRKAAARTVRSRPDAAFVELAATLYLFTARLHAEARHRGLEPLLFLAREGLLLRSLFQRYQELSPTAAGAAIAHQYLVVSRRSTVLAGMGPIDEEDFGQILDRYPDVTLAKTVTSIGLSDDLARTVAADLGVPADSPVPVERLRQHEGFRRRYEQARGEQSLLLRDYVAQVAGPGEGPLHLVDVGWKGTMQDHLQLALGPERTITGWYLGVVAAGPLPHGERKHGLLFDSREPRTPAFRTLRHFKSLYEYLLQAGHGSAARYQRGPDGAVQPVLDRQEDEELSFTRYLQPIQDVLTEVFDELCRLDGLSPTPVLADPEEVADLHARMLFFPTRQELDLVSSLRHYENFGLMDVVSVARSRRRGADLRRARMAVVTDPRRLLRSGWPPLEMQALGLEPLIPVLGLYRRLRERSVPNLTRRVGR